MVESRVVLHSRRQHGGPQVKRLVRTAPPRRAVPFQAAEPRVCEVRTRHGSLIRAFDSNPRLSQSGVNMTANIARRLRTAMMIMMLCIPVSLSYEFIESGVISFIGLAIGIALAMPLALLEESTFDERMRRLPFSAAVLGEVPHLRWIPRRRIPVGRPHRRFDGGPDDGGLLGIVHRAVPLPPGAGGVRVTGVPMNPRPSRFLSSRRLFAA